MASRAQVLACFKSLHRARKQVFEGDSRALDAARKRIKEEFLKYKSETDQTKIQELIALGFEVANILKTSVVQARLTSGGNYRVRFTPDTKFGANPSIPKNVESS